MRSFFRSIETPTHTSLAFCKDKNAALPSQPFIKSPVVKYLLRKSLVWGPDVPEPVTQFVVLSYSGWVPEGHKYV